MRWWNEGKRVILGKEAGRGCHTSPRKENEPADWEAWKADSEGDAAGHTGYYTSAAQRGHEWGD